MNEAVVAIEDDEMVFPPPRDREAFVVLVHQHQEVMFRRALTVVGNHSDAEDVVQEALLLVWQKLLDPTQDMKFYAWMYRIVTRQAFMLVRARDRRNFDLGRLGKQLGHEGHWVRVEASPDPAAILQVRDQERTLRAAVMALPEGLRLCWILRQHQELSYADIATVAGLPISTVRGRIYRARCQLAAELTTWPAEMERLTSRQDGLAGLVPEEAE